MINSLVRRHGRLILVPALITLGVTLLRLVGELQQWSPALFNSEAGGGGALVGIVWLVPIFGIYFGVKLARGGEGPGRFGRAIGLTLLALAVLPVAGAAAGAAGVSQTSLTMLVVFVVASIVAVAIALRAWPEMGRVLLAYGLAARIPVAAVMLIAILADWGTHYDVPPSPDFPQMAPLAKWFWIGLLPQMSVWIAFTIVVGLIFALIAAAVAGRGRAPQAA